MRKRLDAALPVAAEFVRRWIFRAVGVLRREEILEAYQKKIVAGGRYGSK
jgi:hypothetical protein